MCVEFEALRKSVLATAARFVPSLLTCEQAGALVPSLAEMEAAIASMKSLAAARAAEGSSHKQKGYRSPSDELAHEARMSPASAKRALEAGRRMSSQPEVAKAALSGELSFEQAAIVAEGVEADPSKAEKLIEAARHSSLPELSEEVAKVKAAVTDREARRRAITAKRYLRRWTDRDGAPQAHMYGHVEDGAV
ncbi:MAG TPA: hypothetical protein VMD59_10330, partial [Acidimicrobiales bacterium]|nr:hypothetical protein [Acidimicrobiales bacterium]